MKRIISLILLVVMLLSILVSCANDPQSEVSQEQVNQAQVTGNTGQGDGTQRKKVEPRKDNIGRGDSEVNELVYSDLNLLENEFETLDGNTASLDEILQDMYAKGFIVLKEGQVLAEAYYGDHDEDSYNLMYSVTKSMVGVLTGILIDEGKIDPDKEVAYYLPELKDSAMGDATVQNALDMTAALEWNNDHTDPEADVKKISMVGGMSGIPAEDYPYRNTLDVIETIGKSGEHGDEYHYNPSNTEVLGWIITRVSDKEWQDVLEEKIWSQIGAENDLLVVIDEGGHGLASAGVNATLRDMARFGLMMEQEGFYNGNQVVPSEWIEEIFTINDEISSAWLYETEEVKAFGKDAYYHNQYRVLDDENGIMIALGAMGQLIYTDASQDIVGVFQSNVPIAESFMVSAGQVDVMRQITDFLSTQDLAQTQQGNKEELQKKEVQKDHVSRGDLEISELTYSDVDLMENEFVNLENKSVKLDDLLQEMYVGGFIALKDGEVIAESYYGKNDENTHHLMYSVTKSVVGTLTGILIDEGLIDPNKEIAHYIPELDGKGIGDATVQNALDMTIAVDWNNNHMDSNADVQLNSIAGGMAGIPEADFPYRNTLDLLMTLEKNGEHGENYHYNPANTEVLGWIITKVTGEAWQNTLEDRIWSKLGVESDIMMIVDEGGHGFATAGINATLRDMARYGLMIEQDGVFNDRQIVSSEWIEDIYAGNDEVKSAWLYETNEVMAFGEDVFYHNQYRVLDSEKGIMIALGAMGQLVYTNASENIVIVYQSNVPMAESFGITALQISLAEQIAEYMRN